MAAAASASASANPPAFDDPFGFEDTHPDGPRSVPASAPAPASATANLNPQYARAVGIVTRAWENPRGTFAERIPILFQNAREGDGDLVEALVQAIANLPEPLRVEHVGFTGNVTVTVPNRTSKLLRDAVPRDLKPLKDSMKAVVDKTASLYGGKPALPSHVATALKALVPGDGRTFGAIASSAFFVYCFTPEGLDMVIGTTGADGALDDSKQARFHASLTADAESVGLALPAVSTYTELSPADYTLLVYAMAVFYNFTASSATCTRPSFSGTAVTDVTNAVEHLCLRSEWLSRNQRTTASATSARKRAGTFVSKKRSSAVGASSNVFDLTGDGDDGGELDADTSDEHARGKPRPRLCLQLNPENALVAGRHKEHVDLASVPVPHTAAATAVASATTVAVGREFVGGQVVVPLVFPVTAADFLALMDGVRLQLGMLIATGVPVMVSGRQSGLVEAPSGVRTFAAAADFLYRVEDYIAGACMRRETVTIAIGTETAVSAVKTWEWLQAGKFM